MPLTWLTAIVDHSNDWTPWKIVWPTIDRSHRDSTIRRCVPVPDAPASPECCKRSAVPRCSIRAGTICKSQEKYEKLWEGDPKAKTFKAQIGWVGERMGKRHEKWLYHNNIDWKRTPSISLYNKCGLCNGIWQRWCNKFRLANLFVQSWLKDAPNQPTSQPANQPGNQPPRQASKRPTHTQSCRAWSNLCHQAKHKSNASMLTRINLCQNGGKTEQKMARPLSRLIATCTCGWLTNCWGARCSSFSTWHWWTFAYSAYVPCSSDFGHSFAVGMGHSELSNHGHRRRPGPICSAPSIYGRLKIWPTNRLCG